MNFDNKEVEVLIRAEDLFKEITDRQTHPEYGITVINVLSPQHFEDCRIKNSINVDANNIGDYTDDWDRTRLIALYGANEDLTSCKKAYNRLTEMGFYKIRVLVGGMAEWLDKGYPTEGACKMDYLQK